jgi:hypothetical protein
LVCSFCFFFGYNQCFRVCAFFQNCSLVLKYRESRRGQILDSDPDSNKKENHNTALSRDNEEIQRIRLRQQEIANERSIEAAKIRKQKEDEERERKNHIAKEKKKNITDGNRLGHASDTGTGGFNPLQPWSSTAGGARYR